MSSPRQGNIENMAATGGVPVNNDYVEETHSQRLIQKAKEAPFVPIGIAGMLGTIAWGAYTFKKRGKMSTSIFLMHLRVKAQGMVVGAITIGMAYSLLKDYVFDKKKHDKSVVHKGDKGSHNGKD